MPATLSCIIPAYNEADRIGAVLDVVAWHPAIDEVIVVDDGSSDGTAATAAGWPGVRCLTQRRNGGKTAALLAGLKAATGEFVLLLDADLEGLSPPDLSALIAPVRTGHAQMSISLRANAPSLWRRIGLDYISGERVVRRDILDEALPALAALPRFGFEVFLNRLVCRRQALLAVVLWPAVHNRIKVRKHGLWKGLRGDIVMMADIFRTCGPLELTGQIVTMRRLRIDPVATSGDRVVSSYQM